MHKYILALLAFSFLKGLGQTYTEQKNIETTKTEKHILIPGTRLYIVHPPDFKIAGAFTGLQKENDGVLQVYDLNGGNYYTNAASFSKEAFEKKGAKVFDYKEFKVNTFPAKYIFMQGEQNRNAISLVFGDSTFSTMIMALYLSKDTKTGEQLQQMIHTIYYDKTTKTDPFAKAGFTLDERQSTFKFSRFSAGIFIYSVGGISKPSYNDEPFVTINQFPKEAITTAKDVSDMLVKSMEKHGLTNIDFKNHSITPVNGQSADEVEIHGKMKGTPCIVYQLIVAGLDKCVAIQGIVKSDFNTTISEVRKLARTIVLK